MNQEAFERLSTSLTDRAAVVAAQISDHLKSGRFDDLCEVRRSLEYLSEWLGEATGTLRDYVETEPTAVTKPAWTVDEILAREG